MMYEDKKYFERRIRKETEMAARAPDPRVAARHFELARAYNVRLSRRTSEAIQV